jgi:hypothetical protein
MFGIISSSIILTGIFLLPANWVVKTIMCLLCLILVTIDSVLCNWWYSLFLVIILFVCVYPLFVKEPNPKYRTDKGVEMMNELKENDESIALRGNSQNMRHYETL